MPYSYVVRDASQLASEGQEGGETGDAIRVWGLWWCGCEREGYYSVVHG